MAEIGNFGKEITFTTNAEKVLAPKNMKREVSARTKQHNLVAQKPKIEFIGPDLDETTMTIVLSAEHGVKPRKIIEKLEAAVASGTVANLVIGGKSLGKVYISKMSETWDTIWNQGELVRATLDITFSEYR
nr:phage tail protein [uncultured Dysosmobacter sp.]